MAGLLSLPVELLQEISILGSDMKNARAICRYMNYAIEPILFESLTLDTWAHSPEVLMSQLEALATRQTRAVMLVKKLEIGSLYYTKHLNEPESAEDDTAIVTQTTENIKKFLQPAISAMKNVHSVNWTRYCEATEGGFDLVTTGLVSLSSLKHFRLDYTTWKPLPSASESLGRLHSLQSLSYALNLHQPPELYNAMKSLTSIIRNSPCLSSLHLDIQWLDGDGPTLVMADMDTAFASLPKGHPLNLDHLSIGNTAAHNIIMGNTFPPFWHSLTSLTIDYGISTTGPFWHVLQRNKVQLKRLRTGVSHEMLRYLASFSGLEELVLGGKKSKVSTDDAQTFGRQFYTTVLPMHASSLDHLSTFISVPSWYFDEYAVAPVYACQKLVNLEVVVKGLDAANNGDSAGVVLLLDTVASLPLLRSLKIHSQSCRGSIPRRTAARRRRQMRDSEKAVEDGLTSTEVKSTSVIVQFNGRTYKAVPDEKDGKLRYRQPEIPEPDSSGWGSWDSWNDVS